MDHAPPNSSSEASSPSLALRSKNAGKQRLESVPEESESPQKHDTPQTGVPAEPPSDEYVLNDLDIALNMLRFGLGRLPPDMSSPSPDGGSQSLQDDLKDAITQVKHVFDRIVTDGIPGFTRTLRAIHDMTNPRPMEVLPRGEMQPPDTRVGFMYHADGTVDNSPFGGPVSRFPGQPITPERDTGPKPVYKAEYGAMFKTVQSIPTTPGPGQEPERERESEPEPERGRSIDLERPAAKRLKSAAGDKILIDEMPLQHQPSDARKRKISAPPGMRAFVPRQIPTDDVPASMEYQRLTTPQMQGPFVAPSGQPVPWPQVITPDMLPPDQREIPVGIAAYDDHFHAPASSASRNATQGGQAVSTTGSITLIQAIELARVTQQRAAEGQSTSSSSQEPSMLIRPGQTNNMSSPGVLWVAPAVPSPSLRHAQPHGIVRSSALPQWSPSDPAAEILASWQSQPDETSSFAPVQVSTSVAPPIASTVSVPPAQASIDPWIGGSRSASPAFPAIATGSARPASHAGTLGHEINSVTRVESPKSKPIPISEGTGDQSHAPLQAAAAPYTSDSLVPPSDAPARPTSPKRGRIATNPCVNCGCMIACDKLRPQCSKCKKLWRPDGTPCHYELGSSSAAPNASTRPPTSSMSTSASEEYATSAGTATSASSSAQAAAYVPPPTLKQAFAELESKMMEASSSSRASQLPQPRRPSQAPENETPGSALLDRIVQASPSQQHEHQPQRQPLFPSLPDLLPSQYRLEHMPHFGSYVPADRFVALRFWKQLNAYKAIDDRLTQSLATRLLDAAMAKMQQLRMEHIRSLPPGAGSPWTDSMAPWTTQWRAAVVWSVLLFDCRYGTLDRTVVETIKWSARSNLPNQQQVFKQYLKGESLRKCTGESG